MASEDEDVYDERIDWLVPSPPAFADICPPADNTVDVLTRQPGKTALAMLQGLWLDCLVLKSYFLDGQFCYVSHRRFAGPTRIVRITVGRHGIAWWGKCYAHFVSDDRVAWFLSNSPTPSFTWRRHRDGAPPADA